MVEVKTFVGDGNVQNCKSSLEGKDKFWMMETHLEGYLESLELGSSLKDPNSS